MKISVIIPFYNLQAYVQACLQSVLSAFQRSSQNFELEVLCVDDGSADSTGVLLDEWRLRLDSQSPKLTARIIHQANGGEGCARNAGLKAASGEWVTYLDGDDVWLSNMLVEAIPLLVKHDEADIVNLRFAPVEENSELPAEDAGTEMAVHDLSRNIPDGIVLKVGVYPTFFKRRTFSDLEFSGLPLGADRLYVAQCLVRARQVVISNAIVHAYRVRPGSMARAVWTARKVMSQCDYAAGSLSELAHSGKRVGPRDVAYLASLWLSDVPAHLRRLEKPERIEAWRHWRASWSSEAVRLLPWRFSVACALLRRHSFSPRLTLAVARALRKLGVI